MTATIPTPRTDQAPTDTDDRIDQVRDELADLYDRLGRLSRWVDEYINRAGADIQRCDEIIAGYDQMIEDSQPAEKDEPAGVPSRWFKRLSPNSNGVRVWFSHPGGQR
ncbi:hypothetical protein [Geodermatophilus sp. DSM 45219]|uniref:hypothetical protein n=1 Tax=Geodermatophilus sp. DSM 45219 TaxID=1881103 RepID=UPI00088A85F8|nr:hypothetical protein [Geodermatophilus sp. DSM 45219]SDN78692.1 hypothetical protein SAMN05428965_1621 [Geodermatophilus sp. DSM 45219]